MISSSDKYLYNKLSKTVKLQIKKMDELDIYTSKHIHSVPQIVEKICKNLNFDEEHIKFFVQCAYLHDIGKIFIPSEILQKNGPLTTEEYEIIKTHTIQGANLCKSLKELEKYSKAAYYHHENSDGSGYPKGITTIPIEAELIKIADIYDALINKRQYKEKIDIIQALNILKESLIDKNKANKTIFIALLDVIIQNNELTNLEQEAIQSIKQELLH